MREPAAIGQIFGINIYPYGIGVVVSVLLACLLLTWLWKREGQALLGLRFMLYAIPLCLLFARAAYILIRLNFITVDFAEAFVYRFDFGGYALIGGIVGFWLAAWIFARILKLPFVKVVDISSPAALLVLAGVRISELFTTSGIGGYVDNEALQWFPLAVQNTYGEYVAPIFFWEALAALLLCFGLIRWMQTSKRPRGDAALLAMLIFGGTQILLESLRADDLLRFGFVRVSQLFCVGLVLFSIIRWARRGKLSHMGWAALDLGAVVSVMLLALVEFGLDKSPIENWILYLVMALVISTQISAGILLRRRAAKVIRTSE